MGHSKDRAVIHQLEPRTLLAAAQGLLDPTIAASAQLTGLTVVGDKVFFFADSSQHDFPYNRQLWTSDGTHKGTVRVTTALPASLDVLTATLGSKLYFTLDHSLWQSDGTAKGTRQL